MNDRESAGLLNRTVIRLFGDPASISLEHRILNALTFLAFLASILSMGANIALDMPKVMSIAAGICVIAGATCYWLSRRMGQWRILIAPVFGIFSLLLALSWLTQAGTHGGIGYYFFLVVIGAVLLSRKALVSLALVVLTLLLIELLAPDWILPYGSPEQRFPDVAFSWSICLAVAAAMVYAIYNEYQRERRSRDWLLKQVTEKKELAERSTRDKQLLLSMVCHDIANALTVLESAVRSIKKGNNNKTDMDPAVMVRLGFAVQNIGEIVKSVRMMEAVNRGNMVLPIEPVRLDKAIDKARSLFSERLEERHISLEVAGAEMRDVEVLAEPQILVNHVLSNLLSNAIKFSHDGSSVAVRIEKVDGQVSISVSDQGIGIPGELMPRLFDPLGRKTRPGVDGEPGTGFGLMTVKSFVELFGGSVSVRSTEEDGTATPRGTVVTIRLKSASRKS